MWVVLICLSSSYPPSIPLTAADALTERPKGRFFFLLSFALVFAFFLWNKRPFLIPVLVHSTAPSVASSLLSSLLSRRLLRRGEVERLLSTAHHHLVVDSVVSRLGSHLSDFRNFGWSMLGHQRVQRLTVDVDVGGRKLLPRWFQSRVHLSGFEDGNL